VGVVVEAPVGLQVTPRPPASYFAEEKRGGAGGEKENGFRLPPLTSYSDVFGEWAPGKAPICGFCGEECNDEKVETLKVLPKLLVPKAVNIEGFLHDIVVC